MRLDADPERTVEVPLTVAPERRDLDGVPATVAFAAGETARTFTVSVDDDEVDEDDETVTFGFGTLPHRVSAGAPSSAALTVTDDDHTPAITTASPIEVEENRTAVTTLAATDGDTDVAALTWRIAGRGGRGPLRGGRGGGARLRGARLQGGEGLRGAGRRRRFLRTGRTR